MFRQPSFFSRLPVPSPTTGYHSYRLLSNVKKNIAQFPDELEIVSKFKFETATHSIAQISSNTDHLIAGKYRVVLNGHLNRKPHALASRIFAELRDSNGDVCHLLFDPEVASSHLLDIIRRSSPEESAAVSGYIKRKAMSHSSLMHAPAWELVVEDYNVLNTANLDARRLDELKHTDPQNLPTHFRYLQLRTAPYQNALKARSKASHVARSVLIEKHGFHEIETPILFKSTPEGAREFLVPTRTPGKFYALPQSPQQYKQLLMSSGFTRYFQLARCFRDEDLRADRQPEFTQIDLEMGFTNSRDQVCKVAQDVVQSIWAQVGKMPIYSLNKKGHLQIAEDPEVALPCLTYKDAMAKYGIDKPDLRSSLEFISLSDFFSACAHQEFPLLEACVLRGVFDPSSITSRNAAVPKPLRNKALYPRRTPIVIPIIDKMQAEQWYNQFIDKGLLAKSPTFCAEKLCHALGLMPGDILAFSQRAHVSYENPTPLGKFRQLAIQEFPQKWLRPIESPLGELSTTSDLSRIHVGSWVVDFPLFSPLEVGLKQGFPQYDYNRLESTHHPFTMAKTQDYAMLQTLPLDVRGEHYDLVINGVEVGGGSRRIHDAQLQRYVFESILKIENYRLLFGHLLQALDMGCPPHAGIALGFDRLCAMLIGLNLIRDVIAFPKNTSGIDPVVESPSTPSEVALREYHIGIAPTNSDQ